MQTVYMRTQEFNNPQRGGSNDSRNSLSPFKASCIYFPQNASLSKHTCSPGDKTRVPRSGHVTPLLLRRPTNGRAAAASRLFLSAALTRERSQTAPEFRHHAGVAGATAARHADTRPGRAHQTAVSPLINGVKCVHGTELSVRPSAVANNALRNCTDADIICVAAIVLFAARGSTFAIVSLRVCEIREREREREDARGWKILIRVRLSH